MIFLTFNDQPGGIFKSQVVEVCSLIDDLQPDELMLISFLPRQSYFRNRSKIKSWRKNSLIIPIIPGIRLMFVSRILFWILNSLTHHSAIIARGPIACYFALKAKKKSQSIVYDGRAAVSAEIDEFHVFPQTLEKKIKTMERISVMNADFRIAVSNQLVKYWNEYFDYKESKHIVIPCWSTPFNGHIIKNEFFEGNEPILVYAGSTAPWQSFPELINFCRQALSQQSCKVLFLTKQHSEIDQLNVEFPGKVKQLFVKESEVKSYLASCDYGLLIRKYSLTNKVSSPVKFAEYLSCQLKIIISPDIGDYSERVEAENLGHIYIEGEKIPKFCRSIKTFNSTKPYDENQTELRFAYKLLLNRILTSNA